MKKCKNIECNNIIEGKKVYCSLTCRNIYVNKYIRDYSILKNKKSQARIDYENNPKLCDNKQCGKFIEYEKKRNNCCSQSCSAILTNKKRDNSNFKFSEQGIESIRKATKEKYKIQEDEYRNNLKKCLECENILEYNKRNRVFCDKECKNKFYQKNLTEYQRYYNKCRFKFGLADYPENFDTNLIKKYGWYAPTNSNIPNLDGISRDHMYSIKEGFINNIDSNIISHPANCKLMTQRKNTSKGSKSSITLGELIEKINIWDINYNN